MKTCINLGRVLNVKGKLWKLAVPVPVPSVLGMAVGSLIFKNRYGECMLQSCICLEINLTAQTFPFIPHFNKIV